ncbi:Malonyl CoA-acyl carrier protein transacylase [Rickettsiales endosymbiont of Paramecium tredecaurelia]|uniref:ACP S-malonyltransferase n=1 Tax=Candidatus Sarmatiella mevalonica TaxID=2770581 RepID=UPI001921303B|nr:ACP S-malonyltransferase [Candidatus Sarmatiella mevalonica]MBL3284653.1 Malonyl CoA-acyl carrier protein transacylase [Candidatus Sarmatiella mevalonica]
MLKKAIIFPGQGSQVLGMGRDFYENFAEAREVFELVDDCLNFKLSNVIFGGSQEDLSKTMNAQPALMCTSVAILRVLQKQSGKNISELASISAGHSLGEYSALCAVESISLSDTVKLLKERGRAMYEAMPNGGAMMACIGLSVAELERMIDQVLQTNPSNVCQIANDNILNQIVVSGHANAIDTLHQLGVGAGAKMIKLKVSGAFHSRLMLPAEQRMREVLEDVNINEPCIPIISNYDANVTVDPVEIKENLALQICNRVRWRETLDLMRELGVEEVAEIGGQRVLTGMLKNGGYNEFNVMSISTVEELDAFLAKWG